VAATLHEVLRGLLGQVECYPVNIYLRKKKVFQPKFFFFGGGGERFVMLVHAAKDFSES
jgi:hypothetical protein